MTEEEKTLTAYHEAGHAIVTINEDALIQFIRQQSFQEVEP